MMTASNRHAILLVLSFLEGFVAGATFQHDGGEEEVTRYISKVIESIRATDSPPMEDFLSHMNKVILHMVEVWSR